MRYDQLDPGIRMAVTARATAKCDATDADELDADSWSCVRSGCLVYANKTAAAHIGRCPFIDAEMEKLR